MITAPQKQILDVLANGPATVPDLSKSKRERRENGGKSTWVQLNPRYTGLGAPAVRSNLKKLVEYGYVTEAKRGRSMSYTRVVEELPETDVDVRKREAIEARAAQIEAGTHVVCQGCLRTIQLNTTGTYGAKDRTVRHGWKSGNPGDKYAWHTGPCLGSHELSLEVSYKISHDCMALIVERIDSCEESLAHFATRPVLHVRRDDVGDLDYAKRHMMSRDDARAYDAELLDVEPGHKVYDRQLNRRIGKVKDSLRHLAHDARRFCEYVAGFHDNAEVAKVEGATMAAAAKADKLCA